MRPAVVEKIENQGRCTWERRGAGDSKSPSPMRAAECFRPLPVIKDVESVRKHETGLERGQWLLRKQRFTVLVHSTGEEGPDRKRKVQFTRRNIFGLCRLDRLQRKKTFSDVNPRPRFRRQVASCHAVNFLGYFRLSQQQPILFEFSFVILDQFDTSKQSLESKIFSCAI